MRGWHAEQMGGKRLVTALEADGGAQIRIREGHRLRIHKGVFDQRIPDAYNIRRVIHEERSSFCDRIEHGV